MKTSISVTVTILKSFPYIVMRSDGDNTVKWKTLQKKDLSKEIKREFLNNRNIFLVFVWLNEGGSEVPHTGVEKYIK